MTTQPQGDSADTERAPTIRPTIGRVVWYFHDFKTPEPRAAIVVFVHDDRRVNLTVFTANGDMVPALNVPIFQGNDPLPASHRCEWMPYQKGQAAKTEALEERLRGDRVLRNLVVNTPGEFNGAKVEGVKVPLQQPTFRSQLQELINRCSKENGSHTPDFVLAEYLEKTLGIFDSAVHARDRFFGVKRG